MTERKPASEYTYGVFITMMPLLVAASTSILSTPGTCNNNHEVMNDVV
jgi:hypothetical protein